MDDMARFYSRLAPLFHLVYPDWEASIERQAGQLDSLVREVWGDGARRILDAACGVGTQALGLARLGYQVTGSDLSAAAVDRASTEAEQRGLDIAFSVADMREAYTHHERQFDVVIACDNSVPHLLTDEDILLALGQFHRCTRPGGGCIVSVRDYEQEDLSKQQIKPYGIREYDGARWLLWQVWDPRGTRYDVTFYFVEDRGGSECRTHVMRTTYYAIGITKLMELMAQAGFSDVRRVDRRYFQPVVIGTRRT